MSAKLFITGLIPKTVNPVYFFVYTIKWIVAVCTLLGGVYLFTPLYQPSQHVHNTTGFVEAISHPISIGLWGGILVVGSLLVIFGLIKNLPQIRSIGFFLIFLARFFQVLTIWLVAGFFPLVWIYPFTLMLITIVLWGMARTEVLKRAS